MEGWGDLAACATPPSAAESLFGARDASDAEGSGSGVCDMDGLADDSMDMLRLWGDVAASRELPLAVLELEAVHDAQGGAVVADEAARGCGDGALVVGRPPPRAPLPHKRAATRQIAALYDGIYVGAGAGHEIQKRQNYETREHYNEVGKTHERAVRNDSI